jgi:hypothetical protein
MIRIYVNNVLVPDFDMDGAQDITTSIDVESEDGESIKKTITSNLTFYGTTYEYIKAELIDPADGLLREVSIRVEHVCEDVAVVVFVGVIQGQTIAWCEGECSVDCTAVEKTPQSLMMDCLKSRTVYQGIEDEAHPRIVYCDEIRPDWLHITLLILGQILQLLVVGLTPIVAVFSLTVSVINAVIAFVNLTGAGIDPIDFDGDASTNTLAEWANWTDQLAERIIGCGRMHPSMLIRRIYQYHCQQCGGSFTSSIFTDPASQYFNTVLFNAQVKKGTLQDSGSLISENLPVMSPYSLLNKLKTVFNARYAIRTIGGVPTLVFERKDAIITTSVWVDPMVLKAEGRLVDGLCYEWDTDAAPAYLNGGYSEDPMDEVGNEARSVYRDIVEWNLPFNASQKGDYQLQFEFGMSRNRRDGYETDTLDSILFWPQMVAASNQYGTALMLSRGISALPKLLIWDGASPQGGVQNQYVAYGRPPEMNFNYPLHFNEWNCAPNTSYPSNAPGKNLYGRFHAMDNPKVLNTRRVLFKFEFEFTQAHITSLDPFAIVPLPIAGGINGHITNITINHKAGTILVSGKA